MNDALSGLIGAIVGGLLVLLGDAIRRRIERRQHHVDQLRLAAADVIASYLKARSHLVAAHAGGSPAAKEDLWPDERQLAFARLFTLPGSAPLRAQVVEVGEKTLELIGETDASAMAAKLAAQLAAIKEFEELVRNIK